MLYACKGGYTLFTGQRERKKIEREREGKKREREREKERERESREYLFLKGMTGDWTF